jgi:dolichol-phosphate mannosyltransferase
MTFTWIVNQLSTEVIYPPLHDRPLLIYSVAALLLGAQMMSIGFLAELITAYQGRDEDSYSIAEQTHAPGFTLKLSSADAAAPPGDGE